MAKRTPNYGLVFALFVIAAGATYWVRSRPVSVAFSADLASLPLRVSDWKGERVPIESGVRKELKADSIASVMYENQGLENYLGLLIVYRKYGRRGFVHRPEMCYPAAGWQIVGRGYTTVPYGGRDVEAREVIAEKDGDREVVVYWFASGDRTEANYVKQQYWMALDRLKPQKYGWAFVRVNCPVTSTDDAARETIRDFVKDASPSLVRVLTGSDAPSAVGRRRNGKARNNGAHG